MDINHKNRWVFSPMAGDKPIAADYAVQWVCPIGAVDGRVLVHCVMNAHQLKAARMDSRLIVLGSIHSTDAVDKDVAEHHKPFGVTTGMHLFDMLTALSKVHHYFEPEF